VLTALLSNEGMMRTEEARRYQSGRHHRGGHVDLFLCWNELHRKAVEEEGTYCGAQIEVVGVPRFDFYFEPWSRVVRKPALELRARPQILLCSNFTLARYRDLPREHGDRHFAAWANYQENYGNHWERIEAHWHARRRFLEYASALAKAEKYDIMLRPHPTEGDLFYRSWLAALPTSQQASVRIDTESNISGLILDCDLEVAEESCTTAIESIIAGKPTIGLVFYRNSPLNFGERSRCHVHCDDPANLPDLVEEQLANPSQPQLQEVRRQHLAKWCASPDGRSCQRIAELVAAAVRSKKPADWSKLTLRDYRRAAKLKTYQSLGQAYHFDPLLSLKRALFGDRYAVKQYAYEKSIKPRDVFEARERLESVRLG
jgi:surface carbohydrate biosynthesis protein